VQHANADDSADCFLLWDLTRAARIPGVGSFRIVFFISGLCSRIADPTQDADGGIRRFNERARPRKICIDWSKKEEEQRRPIPQETRKRKVKVHGDGNDNGRYCCSLATYRIDCKFEIPCSMRI